MRSSPALLRALAATQECLQESLQSGEHVTVLLGLPVEGWRQSRLRGHHAVCAFDCCMHVHPAQAGGRACCGPMQPHQQARRQTRYARAAPQRERTWRQQHRRLV